MNAPRGDNRCTWVHIIEQGTINRKPLIGRGGNLDQSKAYDLS